MAENWTTDTKTRRQENAVPAERKERIVRLELANRVAKSKGRNSNSSNSSNSSIVFVASVVLL